MIRMDWKQYEQQWPEEIKKAQKALNSEMARGIYVYLLLNGKKPFSIISEELNIRDNKLSYHLNKLVQKGLVAHTLINEYGKSEYSYYEISNFGNIYAKKNIEAAMSPYQHDGARFNGTTWRNFNAFY